MNDETLDRLDSINVAVQLRQGNYIHVPRATENTLGVVKGGGNVKVDADGNMNVAFEDVTPTPIATEEAPGLVKSGGDVAVDTQGKMSVNFDTVVTTILNAPLKSLRFPVFFHIPNLFFDNYVVPEDFTRLLRQGIGFPYRARHYSFDFHFTIITGQREISIWNPTTGEDLEYYDLAVGEHTIHFEFQDFGKELSQGSDYNVSITIDSHPNVSFTAQFGDNQEPLFASSVNIAVDCEDIYIDNLILHG